MRKWTSAHAAAIRTRAPSSNRFLQGREQYLFCDWLYKNDILTMAPGFSLWPDTARIPSSAASHQQRDGDPDRRSLEVLRRTLRVSNCGGNFVELCRTRSPPRLWWAVPDGMPMEMSDFVESAKWEN